jgi:hypothetical protein
VHPAPWSTLFSLIVAFREFVMEIEIPHCSGEVRGSARLPHRVYQRKCGNQNAGNNARVESLLATGMERDGAELAMDPWIENIEKDLRQLGDQTVFVEHLSTTRTDGSTYAGVYAKSGMESCAVEIEVWKGPGGWNLTVSDAFSGEFNASERARLTVEALIWLTISGGAAIVASRHGKFLVPAPHQPESHSRMSRDGFRIRREWCPWGVPGALLPSGVGRFNSHEYWQPI